MGRLVTLAMQDIAHCARPLLFIIFIVNSYPWFPDESCLARVKRRTIRAIRLAGDSGRAFGGALYPAYLLGQAFRLTGISLDCAVSLFGSSPYQQAQPRKQEVATGIIDHIYLAGIKAGLERCQRYV